MLAVTSEGLPVGCEVFPGTTYDGHTFLPTIKAMRRRHTGLDASYVAAGQRYIVGAHTVGATQLMRSAKVSGPQRRGVVCADKE